MGYYTVKHAYEIFVDICVCVDLSVSVSIWGLNLMILSGKLKILKDNK